jgi:hypothetical protein
VTGAGGMPWQNCHGYLLLLLILLIVALIVAAQLLWQYFLPSRLVAALDHKRHLPPNTNTLPLTVVCKCIHIWAENRSNFRTQYKSTQNLQTLLGYIFRILQHFATKLCNFTNFSMLFVAVVIYLHLLA